MQTITSLTYIALTVLSLALAAALALLWKSHGAAAAHNAEKTAIEAEKASLAASKTALENEKQRLEAALARAEAEREAQQRAVTVAREEAARLAERIEALARENERIQKEHARLEAEAEERFRTLAAKSLLANADALREQNRAGLAQVLEPMKENLEQFKQAFTQRYDKENAERFALSERVRELVMLNQTIGRETRKLTDALRGNAKVQGDWGEMILDNILERSGFRRGHEYSVQETVTDADGRRLRPDVVISYTEGRKLIIDSKVSIQDYIAMVNADDEANRDRFARAHVASVKKHVAELRCKSYQDAVGSDRVDFVLMFIPHEGAFLTAMNLDESLWQTAFDSRVLIISPTHLMSVIKLVEQVWRHDKQNRNALEIARQAGLMLDKFRGFLDDMERIDKAINGARDAWNSAFAKLSTGPGNLVGKARSLSALGAKAKKDLPQRFLEQADPDTGETDNSETEQ